MSDIKETTDAAVELSGLCFRFANTYRITRLPEGDFESDTDHSVMLGILACSLAAKLYPGLDQDRIAAYALVHDFAEVLAGDTSTIRQPTSRESDEKKEREEAALQEINELVGDGLSWVVRKVRLYDAQRSVEARFVNAVDKICPKITYLFNCAQVPREHDLTIEELEEQIDRQTSRYKDEFPELVELQMEVLRRVRVIYQEMAESKQD